MLRLSIRTLFPLFAVLALLVLPSCQPPVGNGSSNASPVLGARLLADVVTGGQEGSYPQDFTEFNGTVYFSALDYDDTDRRLLYYLAGDTAVRVDSVHEVGSPLTLYHGALYFLSFTPATGQELFRCTAANVIELVEEVRPGGPSGAYLFSDDRLVVFNDWLFFVGSILYATELHEELFVYQPDANPLDSDLVQVTSFGGGSAQASRMAVMGSKLYFFVNPTHPSYDTYLAACDVTLGVSVVNLASGKNNFGRSTVPVKLGEKLWFIAEGPAKGTNSLGKSSGEYDLYSVDDSGVFRLEKDFSDAAAEMGSQLTVVADAAYFVVAPNADTVGPEWHRLTSDGTVTTLGNLNPVSGRGIHDNIDSSRAPFVAALNGNLFFAAGEAYDTLNGYDDTELFSWSGLGLPTKFAEIGVDEVLPTDFIEARWDSSAVELYPSSPQSFTTIGSKVYFQADDRIHGPEVWVIESR